MTPSGGNAHGNKQLAVPVTSPGRKKEGMSKLTTTQVKDLTELLSTVWRGDAGMIEHCLKSSKYIYINDRFIDCCSKKPNISSDLWYDDETSDPGKGYNRFFNQNMLSAPQTLEDNKCYYLTEQYYNKATGLLMGVESLNDWEDVTDDYILMTADEFQAVNAAITEVRADFEKRLENYYKRYSGHIYSRGYWVNR